MKNHNFFTARGIFAIIAKVLMGILIAAGMALLFGFVVMWLWNWLMPGIFGLTQITFWQAWGLVVLAHILFKSIAHPKYHSHDDHWKKHFREKYFNASKGDLNKEPSVPPAE